MHLVDDVHFIISLCGTVGHLFPDFPDVVHTVVGRRVNLDNIHGRTFVNGPACGTLVAGTPVYRMLTVYRFCQNFGNRGFTGTSGSAEKIRMSDSISFYLIFQRCYNMFLPFYVFKVLRAEFTVKSCIAHL